MLPSAQRLAGFAVGFLAAAEALLLLSVPADEGRGVLDEDRSPGRFFGGSGAEERARVQHRDLLAVGLLRRLDELERSLEIRVDGVEDLSRVLPPELDESGVVLLLCELVVLGGDLFTVLRDRRRSGGDEERRDEEEGAQHWSSSVRESGSE